MQPMVGKLGVAHLPEAQRPADLAFLASEEGEDLRDELEVSILDAEAPPDLFEEFEGDPDDNPDVEANRLALREVLGMVTWVVEAYEDNGKLYGYWHGPEGVPLAESAIVTYDSEGTIELESGRLLVEVLAAKKAFDVSFDEDDEDAVRDEAFQQYAERLARHGIVFSAAKPDDLATPSVKTAPDKLHEQLYNQHKG
jgi:hypothetical protein